MSMLVVFAFFGLLLSFFLCLCTMVLLVLLSRSLDLITTHTLVSFDVLEYKFTAELEVFPAAVILKDALDELGLFFRLLTSIRTLVLFVINH